VFQESDQKILFVHDNSSELNTVSSDLLAATTSTADHPQDAIPLDNSQPSDAESPLSVQIIYPRGEPPERQSSQDAEKDEQRTRGPAGSWSHNAESSAGTFTPKREDFSGEPPIGPEGVKSRNNVPFVGILTVEDSKGIEQSIKIIFELEINTPLAPADQNQVITHASMGNLEMELPLPTSKGRSITTLPKVPHLRAQNVEVKVRPSGQQDQYVLTSQHPKKDFLNGNVTAVSETGVTINSVASLTPALHLGVIKKVGEHKERLAASEAFDTANIEIGEDNGAHFWDYPLKYTQTYNSAISLPTHCSTGIYYRNKPVAAVTFLVQACLEINQDARPKRLSKSQIKPCRSTPKLLQLGYKQVKMCFSVVIKKEVHKNFMELQGRDRTGSTVRLHHKFLSTPVDSINETETSSENPLADATVTLKAKKN
jgi:hypothetical protein